MHEKVIEEIDRRIKRLEAEVEILEKSLESLESAPNKFAPKVRNNALYYMVFIAIWMLAGIGVLAYLLNSGRLPGVVNVPLLPYILIATVLLLGGLFYAIWERREAERLDSKGELEGRIRSANLVVKHFYEPLKKALREEDENTLRALADKLLEDPILPGAVQRTNEGDPKMMAYALYLYTSYTPEMRDEVESLLDTLGNRPLKLLLEELLSGES